MDFEKLVSTLYIYAYDAVCIYNVEAAADKF